MIGLKLLSQFVVMYIAAKNKYPVRKVSMEILGKVRWQ